MRKNKKQKLRKEKQEMEKNNYDVFMKKSKEEYDAIEFNIALEIARIR